MAEASSKTTAAQKECSLSVTVVPTKAYDGQKPGTSGLRKKTRVFMQENYLANFVQCIFNALPASDVKGCKLVVGGDGRFYNNEAIQTIIKIAVANGVSKIVVGRNGLLSTPALSAIVRKRKAYGGIILTASHNSGGIDADFGIKYNVSNGGPAPEKVTQAIYEYTQTITSYKIAKSIRDIPLDAPATHLVDGGSEVEVVDEADEYLALMKSVFNFDAIKKLFARADFGFVYDAMHGVGGPYATKIFNGEFGVPASALHRCNPLPDFGKCHPDPNLTYASELVKMMGLRRDGTPLPENDTKRPSFGAAADGDADRNMILGDSFFVTPSDSVAVIAAYAAKVIPFYSTGLKGLARSMPTSMALDLVAKKLGVPMFEVPTGWKFFGNLMDSRELGGADLCPLICGEESFGTGSSHIREKDGIWAVLCWLSILAHKNIGEDGSAIGSLVSVRDIVVSHWKEYGRNVYCRYDYEAVDKSKALQMTARLTGMIDMFNSSGAKVCKLTDKAELVSCDEFEYVDPIDKSVSSNQGWRFKLADGSRFVFRLSGTGSVGATIRLYLERYIGANQGDAQLLQTVQSALGPIVDAALSFSKLEEYTGRASPSVIT